MMTFKGFDLDGLGAGIGAIGGLAKDIRAAVTGKSVIDPDRQAELELKLVELTSKARDAQNTINAIEAASTNWFVAGWRPGIGWVCAMGLFYGTIGKPLLEFVAVTLFGFEGAFPEIDSETLQATLFGMLGLGAMRTVEKLKDSSSNH
jgi:hypothetical protein